uniref:Uncharacterized protein n=1 Tax=Rhizophora mucronata TaxID=61149 RepID=A0A2P2PE46_RHIMU
MKASSERGKKSNDPILLNNAGKPKRTFEL